METSHPLIPRKLLLGNPERTDVAISPDGAHISFLAPLNGVLNLWVAPRADLNSARPVTHETIRGVAFYLWAFTNQHLLYAQDTNGDENYRLYAVELATDAIKCLTPLDGVRAQPYMASYRHPDELMIGLNLRDASLHDVYRLNILTGEMVMVEQNPGFTVFNIDGDFQVRFAARMTLDGGAELLEKSGQAWEVWEGVPPADAMTTAGIGFDLAGETFYMVDSRGRDTSAVVAVDLKSRKKTLLAEDPQADVADFLIDPALNTIQAVSFIYDRKRWQVLDPAVQGDLDLLNERSQGEIQVVSRTLDDHYWIVLFHGDDHPTHYYLYDRREKGLDFLFSSQADLEYYPMVKMHSAVIRASDGLDLVAYYSLPAGSDSHGDGIPDRPLPVVFTPHGGPWGRENWGFNPWHQWLTSRGYGVLNVNFRSSTGFGKAFTNAGDKEWGGKIMLDQIEAVRWAVALGIADPARVAVMGGSFGGYSTLAGLTMYPEVFACGVDLFGPVNLITLIESTPPYWKPMLELLTHRVGDPRTEEGRVLLKKHSPLTYVDQIACPLLIGQGANDVRVKQAESDQIVQAMQAGGLPLIYLLYPDEGHGFARPENRLSFYAIAEAFLARYLGGGCEPFGSDLAGASMQILVGKGNIPGPPQSWGGPGWG